MAASDAQLCDQQQNINHKKTLTVGVGNSQMQGFGIFLKVHSVTRKASSNYMNFKVKPNCIPNWKRATISLTIGFSLIDWKIPLHVFLFFFTCLDGTCNINNKLSGIFLWPCAWLFFSWYEQLDLTVIFLPCLYLFISTNLFPLENWHV